MSKLIVIVLLMILLIQPVCAMEFVAPEAPSEAATYLQNSSNFWEDLLFVFQSALKTLQPTLLETAGVCLSVIAVILMISMVEMIPGTSSKVIQLAGTVGIGILLLKPANTFIRLGTETIQKMSEYGKLILPVMTAALAAQGAPSTSSALYLGTAFLDSVLVTLISGILVPLLYIHIALCLANISLKEQPLKNMRDFSKWLITWSLKIILYVFTGYVGLTNVISGTTDAAALKAMKLTISGAVPVIGSILSDASEAILVSANVMKNSAGIYGIIAMLAIFLAPFLKIGVQYLLFKITAAVCGVFGSKDLCELVHDFSGAMGIVLAMTGTVCLLLLISTVCFMKGGL